MSLKKKSYSALIWSSIDRFGYQVIHFIVVVILARLLSPREFGLVGILSVVIAVSMLLINSGFGQALIQSQKTVKKDYSVVFTFNILLSGILYGTIYLIAPFVGVFFGEPILVSVLRILALNLILNALCMIHEARASKLLLFKRIALANMSGVIVGSVVAIGMAWNGSGVWALVGQALSGTAVRAVYFWTSSNWRPTLNLDFRVVRTYLGFSVRLLSAGFLNLISDHVMNVILGRQYSSAQVGLYAQGKKLPMLPVNVISQVAFRVSFPALSSIQHDIKKLLGAYRRMVRTMAFFIMPLMGILAGYADPIVQVVLGEKWMQAVPILRLYAIWGALMPILSIHANAYKVLNRLQEALYIRITEKAFLLGGLLLIINRDLIDLVLFEVLVNVFTFLVFSIGVRRLIVYRVLDQLMDVIPFAVIGITFFLSRWVVEKQLGIENSYLLLCIAGLLYALSLIGGVLTKTDGIAIIKDMIAQTTRGKADK